SIVTLQHSSLNKQKILAGRQLFLCPAIHFFSSRVGVNSHPDAQRKVLAVDGPTCLNRSCTASNMRSSSFPNVLRYFWKEPKSFSSFKNSPALCTVAWIFFPFRTMPVSVMSFLTSLSENRETLLIENPANAFWKLGHFFSITFQLRPAVKSDLVIRSKYSSSFLGGFAFQLGDTDLGRPV